MSTSRVIHDVNKTLNYLAKIRYPWLSNMPFLWLDMMRYLESYKPIIITKTISWQAHHSGWFKCSTDGASKGNLGPSSLGFCVRNDVGDLVYARAINLGINTNVVVEAKVIMQGLTYYVEQDLHTPILETDSLVLKKVIESEWDPPWSIITKVQKIKDMKDHFNMIFQHVFRKGNTVADFIANTIFSFAGTSEV